MLPPAPRRSPAHPSQQGQTGSCTNPTANDQALELPHQGGGRDRVPQIEMHHRGTPQGGVRAQNATVAPAGEEGSAGQRGSLGDEVDGPNHREDTAGGGGRQRIRTDACPQILHKLGNDGEGRHRPPLLPTHAPARPQEIQGCHPQDVPELGEVPRVKHPPVRR
jgi:hypothetical protein